MSRQFRIEYLLQLRGQMVAQLAKLAKQAGAAQKSVHGAGAAATMAERAAKALGASSGLAARGLAAMGSAAAAAQAKLNTAQVAASRMANTALFNRGYSSMGGYEKQIRQAGKTGAATILAARKADARMREAFLGRSGAGRDRGGGRPGSWMSGALRLGGASGVIGRVTGMGPGMIGTAGAAIGAKSLLSRFADFQSAEIFVKAIGARQGHSMAALNQMAKQARELGASTIFEPQDVLAGHLKFLQAGRGPRDAMVGIRSTLNLAATAGTSVEKATNVALNLMAQAQIPAKDLGQTMDFLTATFLNSKSELLELAQASKYALPILTKYGVPIQEQFAALGALSEGGLAGTMGARGLRQIMTSMTKIPFNKKKAGLLKQWGLDLKKYFSKGKLRDFPGFVEALAAADSKSGNTLIPRLFPTNAITAMQTLIAQMETFRRVRESMKNSTGINADIALSRFKGLTGAIKEASAAWSELGIMFGEAGAGQAVEKTVRSITETIKSFRDSLNFASLIEEMMDPKLIFARAGQITANLSIGIMQILAGALEAALNRLGSIFGSSNLGQSARSALGLDHMIAKLREAREKAIDLGDRRLETVRSQVRSRAPLWANQLDPRILGIVGQAQAASGKMSINPNTAKRMLTPPASNPGTLLGGIDAYERRLGGSSITPVARQSVDVTVNSPTVTVKVDASGMATAKVPLTAQSRNRGDTSTSSAATETP